MKKTAIHKGYFTLELLERDNGIKREILRAKDAVSLLIYVPELQLIVVVRQRREALVGKLNPDGLTVELIAGRLDKKGKSIREIAAEEAMEEAGIKILPEQIELLNFGQPVASSSGLSDETVYLAYTEITPDQIVSEGPFFGNSAEGEFTMREFIRTDELPRKTWTNAQTYAQIQWFLNNKLKGGK